MNKEEFLAALAGRINALSYEDVQRSLDYYAEMIDDRVDDGMTEEEAVAALGSLDDIIYEIMDGVPLKTLVKAKASPGRSLRVWEIALLVLGSPIWLPLLAAVLIVFLSLYLVHWVLVGVLYIVTVSFALAAVSSVILIFPTLLHGLRVQSLLYLGMVLFFGGLAVLLFFLSLRVTKLAVRWSRRFVSWVKSLFARKAVSV